MNAFTRANWADLREYLKRHWTRLTEQDLDEINGNYNALLAMLQLHYGYSLEHAGAEVEKIMQEYEQPEMLAF